jgi:L-asparaginase II
MSETASPSEPLIEVIRGAQVESVHRGAIVVMNAHGERVASIGDVARSVFPRSAIKAMQLLPFVASGGADRMGFTDREIAFACASHRGEALHAEQAKETLARIGLGESDLVCGAHWPFADDAMRAMVRADARPERYHNNCSGKHVAMLAAARDLGAPTAGYALRTHPVQTRIRETLERLCDVDLAELHPGTDGCGAPNWPIPLAALALGFARFVTGEGLDTAEQQAAKRILAACWAYPMFVSGSSGLDTEGLARGDGRVFMKTGAEGVYCGAFTGLGLGFALKIEDGAKRGSEFAVLSLLAALEPDFEALLAARQPIKNWEGDIVGRVQPTSAFAEFLAKFQRAARAER